MSAQLQVLQKAATYPGVDFKNNILLETSDGQVVVFERALALHCSMFRTLARERSELTVPLKDITLDTLKRVHFYLDHYRADGPPESNVERPLRVDLKECLGAWEYSFYENQLLEGADPKKSDNIFLVIKAAQTLGCPALRDLACMALANIVQGIEDEQAFYKLFNVPEPFSADEKNKLYEDYEYRDAKQGQAADADAEVPAA